MYAKQRKCKHVPLERMNKFPPGMNDLFRGVFILPRGQNTRIKCHIATIMDINYEPNSYFPIFSPVEHPFPPFPPQSMLKSSKTSLDASPTLNKGERGNFKCQIFSFRLVSKNTFLYKKLVYEKLVLRWPKF